MLKNLIRIYDENIQWLNFAELKNGALLTVMIALLAIFVQCDMPICVMCFLVIYSISIILVCVVSFIPFLNSRKSIINFIKWRYSKKYKNSLETDNIIFYVNVFLSSKEEYKLALIKIVNNDLPYDFSALEENYIEQIFQISIIASLKYYFFKVAVGMFGILSALIIILMFVA